MTGQTLAAVLFDLDGTLIDSAPDLAGAANDLRTRHGLAPLPYEHLRPLVGMGARGMVGATFDVAPGHERFEPLRDEFLSIYEGRLLRETRPFDGIAEMLEALEGRGLRWGVVTNKFERYAEPIRAGMPLLQRAGVLIGGDTTPHAKPHPEPLYEACRRMGLAPEACAYVGDDLRDIVAGRAAGMRTVAAAWGYLGQGEPIEAWGADHVVSDVGGLLKSLALD